MRVFEAAACGSLLLTNDLRDNGQEDLFRDSEHLVTYTGAEDLVDRAAYYLAHEEARERIAAAGRAEALARHTYRQRMERLLGEVDRAPVQVAVSSAGPEQPAKVEEASALIQDAPAPGYFECARPELLALVPLAARRILDVGCGAGRLGEALKARQAAEVVGIEHSKTAGQSARSRLDQVLLGDVERMELPFAPGSFDAIVCGDVLEHLREPGRLLRRLRDWLHPAGLLIASIPNVRHHSVLRMLLAGDWTYEPAGLLDRTHLRFFTRQAIGHLLERSGLTLTSLGVVPGPGYEEWQRQGKPGEVTVGGLVVRGLSPEQAEEFFVYQYLVTAVPAGPRRAESTLPASQAEDRPGPAAAA
jgi:2-polyprenyl-3-methyl-5-hydroxy-6-metoxy-1,4-benzoquinol methylase